jgi:hypothetical protein
VNDFSPSEGDGWREAGKGVAIAVLTSVLCGLAEWALNSGRQAYDEHIQRKVEARAAEIAAEKKRKRKRRK